MTKGYFRKNGKVAMIIKNNGLYHIIISSDKHPETGIYVNGTDRKKVFEHTEEIMNS